jgi:hypothetical protein
MPTFVLAMQRKPRAKKTTYKVDIRLSSVYYAKDI